MWRLRGNKLPQLLCDAALLRAHFGLLPWKQLCISVGTNHPLGVFFWRIFILMERHTGEVGNFYSTLHSECSAVAGRLVCCTSEKPWATSSLVLEKRLYFDGSGSGQDQAFTLECMQVAVFSLSGALAHLFHGCYEGSCCAEAVIAELVGSGSQVLSFLYLFLLLQKHLCKKLMSSAVCL